MKPSHDDPTERQQRCQAHGESCNCWRARAGRFAERWLTRAYLGALRVFCVCSGGPLG